jgi:hypothetical protein
MKYSYITPKKKSILTEEMQLLLTFFTITLLMLFMTFSFLVYKNYSFTKEKSTVIQAQKNLESSMAKLNAEIAFIKEQKALSERVYTTNTVLKESIKNLFDLIPTRITLSRAELLENGLVLYGITPNKDIYNFMLQAPLRSIFHRTYSSFYEQKNGWLRFVSTNYIDKGEDDEN